MSPMSESGRHGERRFRQRARPGGRILDGPIPGGRIRGRLPRSRTCRQPAAAWSWSWWMAPLIWARPSARPRPRPRQRNALLDIVHVAPAGTEDAAVIMARVKLGEFTRRECPYGTGVPVRLRVECGDPLMVLGLVAAEAELLINGLLKPPPAGGGAGGGARRPRRAAPPALDQRADPRPHRIRSARPRSPRQARIRPARPGPRRARRRSCSAATPPPAGPPRSRPGRQARRR